MPRGHSPGPDELSTNISPLATSVKTGTTLVILIMIVTNHSPIRIRKLKKKGVVTYKP